MGIVVGIDIGGSTTKIAGFDEGDMLKSVQISASNAIASLFGAFGKFLYDNELSLEDIEQVNLTGVGCSAVEQPIYGLPTYKVDEFTANGVGGGYFAQGKKEFMVVSMGTGTSFVGVKDGIPTHLGGIGIGGGTIIGLSKLMLNTNDIDKIQELASNGHRIIPMLFPECLQARPVFTVFSAKQNRLAKNILKPLLIVMQTDQKRAFTDSAREIVFDENRLGLYNLLCMYEIFSAQSREAIEAEFAGKGYGELKSRLGDLLVESLRPIREKYDEIMREKGYIKQVLESSADKVRPIAKATYERAKNLIGLV